MDKITLEQALIIFNQYQHKGASDWKQKANHLGEPINYIERGTPFDKHNITSVLHTYYCYDQFDAIAIATYLVNNPPEEIISKREVETCNSKYSQLKPEIQARIDKFGSTMVTGNAYDYYPCSAPANHKTQHWATVEGERVNWE